LPFAPSTPPAGAPEPPGPAGLTLEQYASLCVEIAFEPAKVDDTLLRYRIDAEQRRALDDHWQRRMMAAPSLWMRFDQAYAAYQKWYVATRQK
jgi:glutathionylspermidine synthase